MIIPSGTFALKTLGNKDTTYASSSHPTKARFGDKKVSHNFGEEQNRNAL